MIREKIEGSSNILELGFELVDAESQTGTMEVRFKNQSLYRYEGVEAKAYTEIHGAQSIGSAFQAWLKSPEGRTTECDPLDAAACDGCGWTGSMRGLRREDEVNHCPMCDSTMIQEDLPR